MAEVAGQLDYKEAKNKSAFTLRGSAVLSELRDSYKRRCDEALARLTIDDIGECLEVLNARAEDLSSMLECLDHIRLSSV